MSENATILDGFRLLETRPVDEVRGVARLLEHVGSGARILQIEAADAENLFSISFRTPPPDDSGMTHIIEHSVLAGSRRFPVRDPFFEMVKMSMATFINAMTGADCTYYPVCSNVRQDLFNLADVYFDAVFHPMMTEDTLKKEGHHLAPADPADPAGALTVTGIVYNEMKSAYSDPESRMYYDISRALFPESVYGLASGGDPEAIPSLTYARFMEYYRAVYHPSNAYFVLYGNIPLEAHLAFLKPRLDDFKRQPAPDPIRREPRWTTPRRVNIGYPVGEGEPLQERTFLVMEWLVGNAADRSDAILLHLLGLLLVGHEAAPLKRALIDSQLGQALVHTGMSSRGCEGTFAVGLKGSEAGRVEAFEALVRRTLAELAACPFAADQVEAAFQQAGYHFREIEEQFPLEVLERVLHGWVYGRSPLDFLGAGACLEACHDAYRRDPALFNRLLRERLVDNPHVVTLAYAPDAERERRDAVAFGARMAARRAELTDAQMRAIAAEAEALQRAAGEPNSPAALATLPQLRRTDLPPAPQRIGHAVETIAAGTELIVNDVFTNGINYLALELDLAALPDPLWDALPRFVDALNKLGAGADDYARMAMRKARHTGGISVNLRLRSRVDAPEVRRWGLQVSMRFLDEGMEEALDVLEDSCFAVNPRDARRFQDVLVQALAGYRTGLVQAGTSTAIVQASRGLSAEGALTQRLRGLPQLRRTEALAADVGGRREEVMGQIEAIRAVVAGAGPLTAGFTGSARALEAVRRRLRGWAAARGAAGSVSAVPGWVAALPPHGGRGLREGLVAPIQVAHCAQVLRAPHASSPDAPLLLLATKLLAVDYMVSEIRFKGNAYGAQCHYADSPGALVLGSYADPHIARTLKVFQDIRGYIEAVAWSDVELDRAIINAAKGFHRPVRPGAATLQTLDDHRVGRTDALVAGQYAALLAARVPGVKRAVLEVLDRELAQAPICVMAGAAMLEKANRELDRPLVLERVLGDADVAD